MQVNNWIKLSPLLQPINNANLSDTKTRHTHLKLFSEKIVMWKSCLPTTSPRDWLGLEKHSLDFLQIILRYCLKNPGWLPELSIEYPYFSLSAVSTADGKTIKVPLVQPAFARTNLVKKSAIAGGNLSSKASSGN